MNEDNLKLQYDSIQKKSEKELELKIKEERLKTNIAMKK